MSITISLLLGLVWLLGFIYKLQRTPMDDSDIDDLDLIEKRDR